MTVLQLTALGQAVLNGSGAATIQLGPAHVNEQWAPSLASVWCSANVTTGACQCQIYAPDLSRFIDGTFSGDTGDSTDNFGGISLWPGQYVYAVFTGGVPGALANLRIQGQKTVP